MKTSSKLKLKQKEKCEICKIINKEGPSSSHLISACDCNKKHEDRGRVHYECLMELITAVDPEKFGGPPKCVICNKEYRFKIEKKYNLNWSTILSWNSLRRTWRVIINLIILGCSVFVVGFLLMDSFHSGHLEGSLGLILFILVLGFTLVGIALYSIKGHAYQWSLHNSDIIMRPE